MHPLLRVALIAALGSGLLACGNDPEDPPSTELQGVVAPAPGAPDRTVIFLGHRPDLGQQMQEALVGIENDEIWYRIDLPTSGLPAADQTASFDLGISSEVTLTHRMPFAPLGPSSGPPDYATLSFESGGQGLFGALVIVGAQKVPPKWPLALADDGQRFWIGFWLCYKGPLEVNGFTQTLAILDLAAGLTSSCPF